MPLLAKESVQYPEHLFGALDDEEPLGPWWVLRTRPRAEKALARRFLQLHLPFFLPVHCRRWRTRGRQHAAYLPLFPCYLFIRGDDVRRAVLETNQVAQILDVPDQPAFDRDVAGIHRLMASGRDLTPEEQLPPGSPVLIEEGPFAGLRGRVIKRGAESRLVVEVTLLKQGVSVELDVTVLRLIE